MSVVIVALEYADGSPINPPMPYLAGYDPDGRNGHGDIAWTYDRAQAKRFDSNWDALATWKQVSTVKPRRWDGRPNRPLTAFTIVTETVDA